MWFSATTPTPRPSRTFYPFGNPHRFIGAAGSSTTVLIWTLACWLVALRRTRRGLTPPVGCLMLGKGSEWCWLIDRNPGPRHAHPRQQPSFKSQAHGRARFGPLLGKSMDLSTHIWRSSLLGNKENVVQKETVASLPGPIRRSLSRNRENRLGTRSMPPSWPPTRRTA